MKLHNEAAAGIFTYPAHITATIIMNIIPRPNLSTKSVVIASKHEPVLLTHCDQALGLPYSLCRTVNKTNGISTRNTLDEASILFSAVNDMTYRTD